MFVIYYEYYLYNQLFVYFEFVFIYGNLFSCLKCSPTYANIKILFEELTEYV